MPYASTKQLPKGIRRHLPSHAQNIFRSAFNSAHKEHGDEKIAFKIAWGAVKRGYKKKTATEAGGWTKTKKEPMKKSDPELVLVLPLGKAWSDAARAAAAEARRGKGKLGTDKQPSKEEEEKYKELEEEMEEYDDSDQNFYTADTRLGEPERPGKIQYYEQQRRSEPKVRLALYEKK